MKEAANARARPSGGSFTREQKAEVFLQPAEDFDSGDSPPFVQPRKPNDNDLVLENVRPGRYWLKVDPSRGYVASAVAGSADLLRQPLVVGPGGASLPIEIVLRDDGATIEGTVEGMPPAPGGAAQRNDRVSALHGSGLRLLHPAAGFPRPLHGKLGFAPRVNFSFSNFLRAPIACSPSTARKTNSNIRMQKRWRLMTTKARSFAWPGADRASARAVDSQQGVKCHPERSGKVASRTSRGVEGPR